MSVVDVIVGGLVNFFIPCIGLFCCAFHLLNPCLTYHSFCIYLFLHDYCKLLLNLRELAWSVLSA